MGYASEGVGEKSATALAWGTFHREKEPVAFWITGDLGLVLAPLLLVPIDWPKRPSNNRFERSRGGVFGGPRRGSMIWIKQLRLTATQPRVAQPHR